MRRFRLSLLTLLVAVLVHPVFTAQIRPGPVRAVDGPHLTVDGVRKFLVFISYFDALRADPSSWISDLNFFQQNNISGVRILPNWSHYACAGQTKPGDDDSLIRRDGTLNQATLQRLKNFLAAASARQLIVDVTFTRDTLGDKAPKPPVSFEAYKSGIQRATTALSEYRDVLFDVQNEWPSHGGLNEAQVLSLVAAVRAKDPQRLVTGSTDYEDKQAGVFARAPGIGFAAHHDERERNWYDLTDDVVRAVRDGLAPSTKPIYLQEPMPVTAFCPGQTPFDANGAHHRTAVVNARSGGAAAWTFHTRTAFDLAKASFVQRASQAEKDAVAGVGRASRPSPAAQLLHADDARGRARFHPLAVDLDDKCARLRVPLMPFDPEAEVFTRKDHGLHAFGLYGALRCAGRISDHSERQDPKPSHDQPATPRHSTPPD